ncbi:MAG: nitroreductase/quinone reductase family protein [Actinobacteria bacterium]|nr:nitroreductase/quinone reductase family protein [Actinomycetota bacterium]
MTTEVKMPQDIPPAWANRMMVWALHRPVLRSWIGSEIAVLTFTGRRTGKRYTIPISYQRDGDVVTMVTKRARTWWHNFETPAEVELRLAGKPHVGKAEVMTDYAENLEFMTRYLARRPIDAKAYGLGKDEITKDKVAEIMPHIVLIRIEIAPLG